MVFSLLLKFCRSCNALFSSGFTRSNESSVGVVSKRESPSKTPPTYPRGLRNTPKLQISYYKAYSREYYQKGLSRFGHWLYKELSNFT